MSSNDNKQYREGKTLDAILPKKGRLLIGLNQIETLRLKQPPPTGSKVCIMLHPDGNTTVGIISDSNDVQMTNIRDVQRVAAARGIAQKLVTIRKKSELETALLETVAGLVGPIDPEKLKPTSGAVQEIRRVRMDYNRITDNIENMKRLVVPALIDEKVNKYLLQQAKLSQLALKEYITLQLTRGNEPRENISLNSVLMKHGIPRAVFGKLVQPNMIENAQVRLDKVLFGSKISKGLRLSYEEIMTETILSPALVELLLPRNEITLRTARNLKLQLEMQAGLDEVGKSRLNRAQLVMVGPGDYSKEWEQPQPMPVVPYQAPGEIILKINQLEVNFHSGVVPVGIKPSTYWSKAITEKEYPDNIPRAQLAAQVVVDAQGVTKKRPDLDVKTFPRDHRVFYSKYVLRESVAQYYSDTTAFPVPMEVKEAAPPPFIVITEGMSKADKEAAKKTNAQLEKALQEKGPVAPVLDKFSSITGKPDPKAYLKTDEGKGWIEPFLKKLFLKTAKDGERIKNATAGAAHIVLPPKIMEYIMSMQGITQQFRADLVNYLTQFHSESLARQAFITFRAEMQRMEADGSWAAPMNSTYDVDDDPEDNWGLD